MAGTARSVRINAGSPESSERAALLAINELITDIEVLRAGLNTLATNFNATLTKLDADAGVTDVNYSSLQAVVRTSYDTASDLTAAKVNDAYTGAAYAG